MAKYVVINVSYWDGSVNGNLFATFDTYEEAERCAQVNIAEDFSCDSFDEFTEEFDYEENWSDGSYGEYLYMISRCDDDGHEEIYKVYKV